MKKFVPFAHAKSIYEVSLDFFTANNVKIVFLDLDNTLDSYKLRKPAKKAKDIVKKLTDASFKVDENTQMFIYYEGKTL